MELIVGVLSVISDFLSTLALSVSHFFREKYDAYKASR
ncbi:hypothetical protein J2S02_002030 [Metabacillus niabensis]|uniref:Holin n=1 Tax=Metabacillus niabensis TaxID=324854 RepID=A0ABT9Z0B8_9BACI|nr:hypothetical protein [Metabacillus niabensis]